MFKKILQPKNEYLEEGNFVGQFTFGFELEAWYSDYFYETKAFNIIREYWEQFDDINLNVMNFDYDSTIKPDGFEEYEPCYSCDYGRVECLRCDGSGVEDCSVCENGMVTEECPECLGVGQTKDSEGEWQDCKNCNSSGEVQYECPECEGRGSAPCSYCDGEGYFNCQECGGTGEIYNDDVPNAYEFKSPAMSITPKNISRTIQFLKNGIKEGYINTNETCGFHIHIGFPEVKNSDKDIFWALSVLSLDEEKFNDVIYFGDKQLFGEYAGIGQIKNLGNRLKELGEVITNAKGIMFGQKEREEFNMGAFNLDVKENMYKGYKEDFYTEAKYKPDNSVELGIVKDYFIKNISYFYNDKKYNIFRQHPQGTLEWRGARGFMDSKEINKINDFLINKFYKLVKYFNEALNKKELYLGSGQVISKEVFYELLDKSQSPSKSGTSDKRFNKKQDRKDLASVFSKNTWLNKVDLRDCNLYMSEGILNIRGINYSNYAFVDFKFQEIPDDVKIFAEYVIINNCNVKNIKAEDCNFSVTRILNGSFKNCNFQKYISPNFEQDIFNNPNNLIYGGKFSDCDFINSVVYDGRFLICSFLNSKILDGFFKENEFSGKNTYLKNGRFINSKLNTGAKKSDDVKLEIEED